MLLHLVRKELLEQLLSLRFAIACAVCLAVILSTVVVMTRDYREAMDDYQSNVGMHTREAQKDNDLVWRGIDIDKPLNPMQILFRGVDDELTATVRLNALAEPQFQAHYDSNPIASLFPPIDLLFFVGIVMSLLAIAFSYDAVSGEKEQGSLKLLMSYSVPRDQLLLSKWVGGYLALLAPFLVAVLAGLAIISLFPAVQWRAVHWLELGLILGIALLYIAAVYSLGVFVSARTHLATTSIMVLLFAWVAIVLVLPNAAPYLAAWWSPTRAVVVVEREKRDIERRSEQAFDAKMRAWEAAHPDDPKYRGAWWAYWDVAKRDQVVTLVDDHKEVTDGYHRQLDGQMRLTRLLSRVSPMTSFVYAAADLAGTGIRDRNRFFDALVSYRKEITRFALDKWVPYDAEGRGNEYTIEGYPRFAFTESALQDRLGSIWEEVLVLAVWNLMFFMAAYLSFLRYDVT